MLFSITCWSQLLAPLEIHLNKNFMKYIPIHSYCIFLAYLAYSVARHDWNFKRYQVQWSDETKKYIFGTREMSLKGYKGIKSTS